MSVKGKSTSQRPNFLLQAIEGLTSRLQSLDVGSGWSGLDAEQESLEILWGISQAIEIVHVLEIILGIVQSSSGPPLQEIILPWFRLMKTSVFFEDFQLVRYEPLVASTSDSASHTPDLRQHTTSRYNP